MNDPPRRYWGALRIALAKAALQAMCRMPFQPLRPSSPARPATMMGLALPNPIGLAAGMDKSGALAGRTAAAGFGFHEVGSVSLANMKRTLGHLARWRAAGGEGVVGVNIACSRHAEGRDALAQYLTLAEHFLPLADYLVLNLSSPFTRRARRSGSAWLTSLLSDVAAAALRQQDRTARRVPLAVKISAAEDLPAPWLETLDHALASDFAGAVLATPEGLSEAEILLTLKEAKARLGERCLVSVGGIHSAAQVHDRLARGASAVQVFSALVDGGPGWVRRIASELTLDSAA